MGKTRTSFNSETAKQAAANRKNPGPRPKIYNILKQKGYGKADIIAAFSELSFYTEVELQEAADNSELPIITRIIAKNMLKAYESGNLYEIGSITEHITGKPTQKVDQKTDFSMDDVTVKFVNDGNKDT